MVSSRWGHITLTIYSPHSIVPSPHLCETPLSQGDVGETLLDSTTLNMVGLIATDESIPWTLYFPESFSFNLARVELCGEFLFQSWAKWLNLPQDLSARER